MWSVELKPAVTLTEAYMETMAAQTGAETGFRLGWIESFTQVFWGSLWQRWTLRWRHTLLNQRTGYKHEAELFQRNKKSPQWIPAEVGGHTEIPQTQTSPSGFLSFDYLALTLPALASCKWRWPLLRPDWLLLSVGAVPPPGATVEFGRTRWFRSDQSQILQCGGFSWAEERKEVKLTNQKPPERRTKRK